MTEPSTGAGRRQPAVPARPGAAAGPTAAAAPPARDRDAAAALAALEPFAARLLPAMLRRLVAWRGLGAPTLRDLRDDALQELAVDCLEHAAEIAAMPPRARHARWFRVVERLVYREHRRGPKASLDDCDAAALARAQRPGGGAPVATPAPPPDRVQDADAAAAWGRGDRTLAAVGPELADLAHHARHHGNGRCHLAATAARIGVHPRQVRRLWERAAALLGYGEEFLAFWRRRLAEALTGLAADLLRDRGAVRLLPRRRQPPDPRGRVRRIRRIHAVLRVRPVPPDVRAAVSALLHRADPGGLAPRRLLDHAARLWPDQPRVLLWRVEAALADGDLRAAAADLRRARTLGADPVAVRLARCRLLELRGRRLLALARLRRAAGRGDDPRLGAALRTAGPAAAGPVARLSRGRRRPARS